MIDRISVQNYQSIGKAELDLGPLTVIVGQGNLGKSALLRAITTAMFNDSGTAHIRNGESTAKVVIEAEEEELIWTKSRTGSAQYILNGKSYTKLGSNVPEDVEEWLAVRTIEIDSTFKLRPQVHGQFDSPILLTESSSKAARALSSLTKLDGIIKAQGRAASDLRSAKTQVSHRTQELEELNSRLEELPETDYLRDIVTSVWKNLQEYSGLVNLVDFITQAAEIVQSAKTLPTLPDLSDFSEHIDYVASVCEAFNRLREAEIAQDETLTALNTVVGKKMDKEAEIEEFTQEFSDCPFCGQPIEKDHSHV